MYNRENNRPGANPLPLILIVVGFLLVAGVIAWQSFNLGQGTVTQGQPQVTQSVNSSIPFPEIQRITLEDAKSAFDNQSALFVDVRSADSYNQAHIPGAINIPLAEIGDRAGELDPNQWIITYCT